MSDLNDLSPKIGRTLRTTTALGRILLKYLGQKIKTDPKPEEIAAFMTEALGTLKGPLMKIGQIFATVPGMLPPAYAKALLSLTNNAPAMGPLFVEKRMENELGKNWKNAFKAFDMQPAFAASLGQVHKATLKNGSTAALKLQYPAMEEAVKTDLRNMQRLLKAYELYDRTILTSDAQKELEERLYEECDYQKEAQHIDWFQAILKGEDGVCIPTVDKKLSTKKLLTLSWLDGNSLLSYKDETIDIKKKLAKRLFRAWWRPFYEAGVIHGDPHLGNYTVNPKTHELNILDFGCVRVFKAEVVQGLYLLFEGLQQNKPKFFKEAYELIGFRTLSSPVIETLNLWARFLYGPLLEDGERPLSGDPSGEEGRRIATRVHAELGKLGGIHIPRTFVFLDRAAVGIGSALIRLDITMNWHQLFQELVPNMSVARIKARQQAILKKT